MKTVSPELDALLADNLTHLCRIWQVTRKDGTEYRFTDHDVDVTFAGELYFASTSFEASAIETSANSAASNMDVSILLSANSIEYLDVERGMFDGAAVELRIVNYRSLDTGAVKVFNGEVFSIVLPNQYVAQLALVGTVSNTNRPINERYSASCRAEFGDARCKVDLTDYTTAFIVDTVPTVLTFTSATLAAEPANKYVLGYVEWTTGDNVGTRVEVGYNIAGTIVLLAKPPFAVQPDDTGAIVQGCPKTVAACKGFNNIPNYRGEPYVPGDGGLS